MAAATEAPNTAIFAAAKSAAAGNACPAMNSDMVKPMPASAPAPANWRQEYSFGFVATPSRTARTEASTMPSGLPSSEPFLPDLDYWTIADVLDDTTRSGAVA
jgi:hypothetical protein